MSIRTDVLAGTGPTPLTQRWFVNGVQSDVGAVTYAVTDANGTAVTSGTATKTGAGVTTVYSFDLPIRPLPSLDKVVWTRTDTGSQLTDWIEVVGSLLFTLAEARARTISGMQTPLSDTAVYPNEVIAEWRLRIADQFEQKTGKSWVRRYCRLESAGWGIQRLSLLEGNARTVDGAKTGGDGRTMGIGRIISVTNDGTVVPLTELTLDGFHLWWESVWPFSISGTLLPLVIEYEYGDLITDPEASDHALRVLLANLVPSDISGYAQNFDTPAGSVDLSLAYPQKTLEWLNRNDHRARL